MLIVVVWCHCFNCTGAWQVRGAENNTQAARYLYARSFDAFCRVKERSRNSFHLIWLHFIWTKLNSHDMRDMNALFIFSHNRPYGASCVFLSGGMIAHEASVDGFLSSGVVATRLTCRAVNGEANWQCTEPHPDFSDKIRIRLWRHHERGFTLCWNRSASGRLLMTRDVN